jgi:flagellar hook assembly protein FlgD
MKPFVAAVIFALLTPALARAETSIVARDVPLRGTSTRVLSSATPRFDLVGLHWQGAGSVEFRTRTVAGRWSGWHPAAPEAEDGPDRPAQPAWHIGNPYWTGASNGIAYRLHGRVKRLRAYFVWSQDDQLPPRRLSVAGSPPIIMRPSWGADESIRRAAPRYADSVRYGLVHHTAGTNSYTRTQSAAIVRGIEVYHVKGNGWNDIGYNFLVDKYGQVFEGRYGGVDKNVIGAHAEGFNTGSFGVAMLGTYGAAAPPAVAQTALENLLAWRLDIAHVDPLSTVTVTSGGNARFAAGVPVFLRAVSGHRDTGFTDCPGNALYARLGEIASQAAGLGLPKLYAPSVQGEPGGPVEFRAKLSTDLPWTVTVTDSLGLTAATGSGTGTDVDWTWDASAAPPGRYGWAISAGADVLPATGFVGAAPVALALKSPTAKPGTISPNGDGVDDSATVTYTLTAAATVTAVLRDAGGQQLATLFSEPRTAGKHTFTFTADGVPDGRYTIVLTADDGTKTVSATVPVTVDRTFGNFAVSPLEFSPNGDGRLDSITFSFRLARAAHVRVDVKQSGRLVVPVSIADDNAGDQSVSWDGMTPQRPAPDGTYAAVVTAGTALGTTVHSSLFRLDTVPPRLRAVSFRRLVFQVSEPARVRVVADGRVTVRSVRAGVFSVAHVGRPRRVIASATDAAGNVSRTIRFP